MRYKPYLSQNEHWLVPKMCSPFRSLWRFFIPTWASRRCQSQPILVLAIKQVLSSALFSLKSTKYSCLRFETGGSLGRRVKCRRVPQPRWVGARPSAKGGKGGRRRAWERWKSRGLRVRPAPRSGALTVGGYKRPRGRGSERPHASACPVLFPARPTFSKRALVLPFIGVRRGSRCTMGV
jgi:hypothetical protein